MVRHFPRFLAIFKGLVPLYVYQLLHTLVVKVFDLPLMGETS